jgi:hypothetical protein
LSYEGWRNQGWNNAEQAERESRQGELTSIDVHRFLHFLIVKAVLQPRVVLSRIVHGAVANGRYSFRRQSS